MKPSTHYKCLSKVKSFFVFLICFCAAFVVTAQSNILINLSEANANPAANRTVTLQAQTPFVGNILFYTSDANGIIITNLQIGVLYNGQIKAPPAAINFQLYLPPGSSGCKDWTNYWAIGQGLATAPAGAVAPSIAMADARYAFSGATLSNNFYPISNPSNFFTGLQVTQAINNINSTNSVSLSTVTNVANAVYSNNPAGYLSSIPPAATNQFATTNLLFSYADTNGAASFFARVATNAYANFAATNFDLTNSAGKVLTQILSSNYVTSIVTNGLATTNFVLSQGYITSGITNGFATTNFVLSQGYATTNQFNLGTNWLATNSAQVYYPTSNPSGFVVSNQFTSATNTLANYAYQVATNQGAQSTNFTLMVSNSLATNFQAILTQTNSTLLAQIVQGNTIISNIAITASNYLGSGKQPANAVLSNLTLVPPWTNSLVGGTNITVRTNIFNQVILDVPNQAQVSLAQYATTNQNNIWYDTNGAGAYFARVATNGLVLPSTNGFVTASITNGLATTNFVIAYSDTNGAAIYNAGLVSNSIAGLQNRAVTNFNQSAVTITNIGNLFAGALNGSSGTAFDGARTFYGLFNGNGSSVSNLTLNNITNVGILAYSNSITSNNISGQINIGQVYGAPTTNNFIPLTNGIATALTIQSSLAFGADTNFVLGTNWIKVGECGAPNVAGQYMQIANGAWTNITGVQNGFPGYSITFAAGTYSILSNNVTLYTSATVNGFWGVGTFGTAPAPYVAYTPTYDAVILGNVYSTNIDAHAFIIASNLTTSIAVGGVVQGAITNQTFSAGGTNAIDSEIARLAQNPTNGITTNTFYALMGPITNNIFMGGVVTNVNTNTIFSAAGTNIIQQIASAAATGIAQLGGFGTNTTLAKAISISSTNFNVAGVGPNAGSITFPAGGTIQEQSPANSPATGDSGITMGYGNGQIFQEEISIVIGATNDIQGASGATIRGASITGGANNIIGNGSAGGGFGKYAHIGGGQSNWIANENWATIGGGFSNLIQQIDSQGGETIPGGILNQAKGMGSFAAGVMAQATNTGSFVWSDGTGIFNSRAPDTFNIFSSRGVFINTNGPVTGTGTHTVNINGDLNATNLLINGVPITGAAQTYQNYLGLFVSNGPVTNGVTNINGSYLNTYRGYYTNTASTAIIVPSFANFVSGANACGGSVIGFAQNAIYQSIADATNAFCSGNILSVGSWYNNPSSFTGTYTNSPLILNTNQPFVSISVVSSLVGVGAGTGITVVTNGSSYIVSATGGGGSGPTFQQLTNTPGLPLYAKTLDFTNGWHFYTTPGDLYITNTDDNAAFDLQSQGQLFLQSLVEAESFQAFGQGFTGNGAGLTNVVGVTNAPLKGGTVVGNLFLGTNSAGQWVLASPSGGGGPLPNLVTNQVPPTTGVEIDNGTPSSTTGQRLGLSDAFKAYLFNGFSGMTVSTNKIEFADLSGTALTITNGAMVGNGSRVTNLNATTAFGSGTIPSQFLPSGAVGYQTFTNILAFGAVGDGVTSCDLAISNAILSGGTNGICIYFPPGKYKFTNDIWMPTNNVPEMVQPSIVLLGSGSGRGFISETHPLAAATTFIMTCTNRPGKIYGWSFGNLTIKDINFVDPGTDTNPFIWVNGTALQIQNCSFDGTGPHQDAIVLGGSGAPPVVWGLAGYDDGFYGYGAVIGPGNLFMNISHACIFGSSANSVVFRDNQVGNGCGGQECILIDGGQSGLGANGNIISGNTFQIQTYTNGVTLTNKAVGNMFTGNGWWDGNIGRSIFHIDDNTCFLNSFADFDGTSGTNSYTGKAILKQNWVGMYNYPSYSTIPTNDATGIGHSANVFANDTTLIGGGFTDYFVRFAYAPDLTKRIDFAWDGSEMIQSNTTAFTLNSAALSFNSRNGSTVFSNTVAVTGGSFAGNGEGLTNVVGVTNAPLKGGTVVGNLFLGTNSAGQWVLGNPTGSGGSTSVSFLTNNFYTFSNSATGEWGYWDTNGILLKTNSLTGAWFVFGNTNFHGGVGAVTNFGIRVDTGFSGNGQGLTNKVPLASITADTLVSSNHVAQILASLGTNNAVIVRTNFNSGQLYTNNYGVPIIVSANAVLTTAAVVGISQLALVVTGSVTNYASVVTAIGGIAGNMTNAIASAFVPIGSQFYFTNTSAGVGNIAIVNAGQIYYDNPILAGGGGSSSVNLQSYVGTVDGAASGAAGAVNYFSPGVATTRLASYQNSGVTFPYATTWTNLTTSIVDVGTADTFWFQMYTNGPNGLAPTSLICSNIVASAFQVTPFPGSDTNHFVVVPAGVAILIGLTNNAGGSGAISGGGYTISHYP